MLAPTRPTDSDAPIWCWQEGGVAHLRFNRPAVLNAINLPMAQAFHAACRALAADDRVRVVVLSGEGRAFMAGGDLPAMVAAPSALVKARTQHGESPCRGKPRPRSRR